jgi:2-keto-4-pentenoate hydratase
MPEIIRPKELVRLRRQSQQRAVHPSELPSSIEGAYDIASATIGILGAQVAAWKLGATTAGTRRTFATESIYFGALLPEEVWTATDGAHVPAPAILRGEAEIAFRLAVDIASEKSEAAQSRPASELFDAWAPAIEAPYSSLENLVEAGLRALLMDRCAAGALYLGAARGNVIDPGINGLLEICADGSCIAQGTAREALLMPPLDAARGFLQVAATQGVNLRRGQWISTGGITPCVPLPAGKPIQLMLDGQTEFNLVVQGSAI